MENTSIAREDKVILVKGAIPGEVVDVAIPENRRDYMLAMVSQVVEPSEYRLEPKCPVFGICGGCQLQYVSYERQLRMKEEVLLDSLRRIGGIDVQLGPSLSGAQWNYRHRVQFKVSKEGTIGFFRESSRDVVTFESCPLLKEEINVLLRRMKERPGIAARSGFARNHNPKNQTKQCPSKSKSNRTSATRTSEPSA